MLAVGTTRTKPSLSGIPRIRRSGEVVSGGSADAENVALRPRPPLGRVLLEAGLLAEDQLDAALTEQKEEGEQLGTILVRRGFVSPHLIASALAEQHGTVLRTEYGVGVGLTHAPEAAKTPLGPPPVTAAGQQHQVPSLRVAELPEEAAPPLSPAPASPPAAAAEETEHEELRATLARTHELAAAGERVLAELEAELERVAAVRAELETLAASLRSGQGESEPYVDDRHYLLVPNADSSSGYDYFERPGHPPDAGSEVEIDGHGRFRVTSLGQVRVPGSRMACAFLEAA
jgi:hypothetical protein